MKKNKKKFWKWAGSGLAPHIGGGWGKNVQNTGNKAFICDKNGRLTAKVRRKSETSVHYSAAKSTEWKDDRKNLQGVGVGVKTPQKTQNLLRVFNLLPKLLPNCYLYIPWSRIMWYISAHSKYGDLGRSWRVRGAIEVGRVYMARDGRKRAYIAI